MFSTVEIAWFSAIPAAIAAAVAWLANRQAPFHTVMGELGSATPDGVHRVKLIGLAIVVATSIAMFANQTQDHIRVLESISSDGSGSLWGEAIKKTAVDFSRPKVAHNWAILIAIAGLVAGKFVASGTASFVRLLVAAAVSGAVVLRLLWTSVYLQSEWTRPEQFVWIGGISLLAGLAWWTAANRINGSIIDEQGSLLGRDTSAHLRLFLFGTVTCLMAAALIFTGSIRYGVAAAIVASASGGTWVTTWRLRANGMTGDWCGPMILLATTLLLIGTTFSELPFIAAILFAASFVFASAAPCSADSQVWRRLAWIALGVLPAVVAVVWAFAIFSETFNNAPVNPYDAYK